MSSSGPEKMPSNPTWSLNAPPGAKRRNASRLASALRLGLILVLASSLGASLVFVWTHFMSGPRAERTKTLAQSLLESGQVPEHGQAAMNALLDGDAPSRSGDSAGVAAPPAPRRKRVIVLSDGEGKWNTGVWPAWGLDTNGDTSKVTLNWAAAGVVVNKVCPVQCEFTRDQARAAEADAVVMELVNHPKFGIPESVAIPWPAKRANPKASAPGPKPTAIPASLPLTVAFYYEAASSYPRYTLASEDVRSHIDLSMTPSGKSSLPISMTCPWGKTVYDYVRPPPAKAPGRLLGYFNEHGVARSYSRTIDRLFELAGERLHSYVHRSNRPLPAEAGGNPYSLATRLDFVGSYKFILVTEAVEEEDWVEPDLSQAWLAGAVPVYIGAPNAVTFAPGPRSFVHARDFPTADALWAYLDSFSGDDEATLARYRAEFFAWKQTALATFMMDEQGQANPIGTGHGVIASLLMPQAALADQLQLWAAQPRLPGAAADGKEASGAVAGVPAIADVTAAVSSLTATPKTGAKPLSFERACEAAWRNFRRRLDQCVHYAECRLCELTTLLTK